MKWLAVGLKLVAHPALLPIALATLVSVAGPGGIAEIGHNVSAVPTVVVSPESPPAFGSVHSEPLLVRVVQHQTPPSMPSSIELQSPPVFEEVVATTPEGSGADETLAPSHDSPQIVPATEPVEPPADTGEQPADGGEPSGDSNTPTQPASDPPNGGSGGDTPAGPGTDPQAPPDDNPADNPPDDGDNVGEDPPQNDGGDDVGEQPPADDGGVDAGNPPDGGQCDVPGNGHDKHEVEPGHDKNGNGIDDRCEPDQGEVPPSDASGEGIGEQPPVDDGGNDVSDQTGVCDVPGNGHDKHDVEPGHDKNNDEIDDRCQEGSPGHTGASAAAHDQNDGRKDDS